MDLIYDRHKTAIVYKGIEYSYLDLLKAVDYYAHLYQIDPQSRVMIYMENRPELFFAFYATWANKCIAIVADAASSIAQLQYMISDATPRVIFTSTKNYDIAKNAIESIDPTIVLINVDEINIDKITSVSSAPNLVIDKRDDIAIIIYTSGTTGDPKGVMLTFDNMLSNCEAVAETQVLRETDRFLAILPFHHIFPLNVTMLMPIYFGTFVVILDELNSERLKKAMKDYQITALIGVPRVMDLLHKGIMNKINSMFVARTLFKMCKGIKSQWLSKKVFGSVSRELGGALRLCVSGGAKLNPDVASDLQVLGIPVIEGYGITETAPLVAFNRPDNIKIGTVGEVIPHVEVKLGADDELLVRGPNVMEGYWGKPEATAQVIDADGWFHTGDIGHLDGRILTIMGRLKEMIVLSNGKNINPGDIEAEIITGSDLIKEVAVTTNSTEEHLIAVIYPDFDVLRHRKITNIKETLKWQIIDKYNITAPKYRKILEIIIVKDELPKTRLGKVRRFMLKDFIATHSVDARQNADDNAANTNNIANNEAQVANIPEDLRETYDQIAGLIAHNFNTKPFPDAHLELDLGLDSLDMMELASMLKNNYGVLTTDEDWLNIKTPLDIARFIKDKGATYIDIETSMDSILGEEIDTPLPGFPWMGLLLYWLAYPIFSIYFRVRGIDTHKVPRDRNVIYVGNHQSFLDAVFVFMRMPMSIFVNTYFLAVSLHFKGKIKGFIARHSHIILIDVNKDLKSSVQMAAKVLKNKKNLVIFPEGARTRDGYLQNFKKTYALLAHSTNTEIVPFGLVGAYEAMPYGVTIPRPHQVTVKYFDAIKPKGKSVAEICDETYNVISTWYDSERKNNEQLQIEEK